MIEPYNESTGPSIDHGVLLRLKRLDPLLRVTYSHFTIDPHFTTPVEVHPQPDWEDAPGTMERVRKRGNSYYLHDPTFYLWSSTPDGQWVLVNYYPAESGFAHREVMKLEEDVGRYMTPSEIARLVQKGADNWTQREGERWESFRLDKIRANKARIEGLVEKEDYGVRDAKIVSYPGQKNRSTPGTVHKDADEDGWETMDKDSYDKSY